MTHRKRQLINNARRRLNRLKERRSNGAEAKEVSAYGHGAYFAMQFISYINTRIKKEEGIIAKLKG